jgi:hypothetical protein
MHRHLRRQLVVLAILAALFTPSRLSAQSGESPETTRARQATVFLMQTYEVSGIQAPSCMGAGTIINSTGLILTDAHLVLPNGPCQGETLVVALPVRLDEPPVPTYLAEPIQIDLQLDLAVVQITGGLDGSRVEPETLSLPYVPVGDSSTVLQGTGLTFVGYPGIGNQSVTATEGTMTGLTAERNGARIAWFRTGAELGGGMAGGGAYDEGGELIGVVTGAPETDGETPGPSCLSIQDTTGDGLITERDACVPVAAEVNAIRPINLALPLITAARSGYELVYMPGLPARLPVDAPQIGQPFFSTQVDDYGTPMQIISRLPSDSRSLFVFFTYDNMRNGTPYTLRVTRDGIEIPRLGLGPLAWGGGQRGIWYIGTENLTWEDGEYVFTIYLSGRVASSAAITVGPGEEEPVVRNLTFGVLDETGTFASTGTLLPAGIERVDAHYEYEGMRQGQTWTEVWYYGGLEVSRWTQTWSLGPSGHNTAYALNYEGLPAGDYRLEIYIDERLAATGELTLAGTPNERREPVLFDDIRLASDVSREDMPAGVTGNVTPFGVDALYAFFAWDNMPSGTDWAFRWFQDGRMVASSTQSWSSAGAGDPFWVGLRANEALAEGIYAVEVLVENRPMFSANITVGSGAGAISGETAEEGVQVSGVVTDAITGEPVMGAMVAILNIEFESATFLNDESQIYTMGFTDLTGHFALPRSLQRGRYYTAYVFAEGYLTIVEDNFTIPSDQPSPTEISIQLTQP